MNENRFMEKQVAAGIIIYRKTIEGPRFLLLFRGYWNFPKGKLTEGEKAFKAALREVWEETGIRGKDLFFVDWFKVQDYYTFRNRKSGEKISKMVSFFLAETKESHVRLSIEHEGYGWFLYREALRLLTTPNLKSNLRKAYRIITQKKNEPRNERGYQKRENDYSQQNNKDSQTQSIHPSHNENITK